MTTPGKPAFGGTVLRIPAIQSPNYVAGVSGWAIFQNGTVEFNSGTFRGTVTAGEFDGTNFIINAAGAFFYTGAPALGNLATSIAPTAGTDAQGNAYIGGIVEYANLGGSGYAAMQYTATGMIRYTSPTGAAGPYGVDTSIQLDATGAHVNTAATIIQGAVTAIGGTTGSPTVITTDAWTDIAAGAFGANFAAGAPTPQIRRYPDNTVRFRGVVSVTGVVASGNSMFTTAYTFGRAMSFVTQNTLSGYALGRATVSTNAGGTVSVQSSGGAGNTVSIDGVWGSLD